MLAGIVPKPVVQPRKKDCYKAYHFGKETTETPHAKGLGCRLEGDVPYVVAHSKRGFGVNRQELEEDGRKSTGYHAQDRRNIEYIGHDSVLFLFETGRRPTAKKVAKVRFDQKRDDDVCESKSIFLWRQTCGSLTVVTKHS